MHGLRAEFQIGQRKTHFTWFFSALRSHSSKEILRWILFLLHRFFCVPLRNFTHHNNYHLFFCCLVRVLRITEKVLWIFLEETWIHCATHIYNLFCKLLESSAALGAPLLLFIFYATRASWESENANRCECHSRVQPTSGHMWHDFGWNWCGKFWISIFLKKREHNKENCWRSLDLVKDFLSIAKLNNKEFLSLKYLLNI